MGVDNPAEGSPDFSNDLSRIYVSMKSSGDNNFGLEYPSVDEGDEEGVTQIGDSPYAIIKSSEVRLVSRGSGSIRIVKEGAADEDKAVIMMLEDGTIMVDGPKIIIGSGIESGNGQGGQVVLGRGATEPIVLGNELKSILNDILSACAAITVPTAVGPSGPPTNIASFTTEIPAKLDAMLSKNGKTK